MTQCKIGKVGWLESKILFVDIEEGKEIGVEQVYELYTVAQEIAKNEPRFNIINYGAFSFSTKEARELCANQKPNKDLLGRALVVHDLGQFIIAKHTLKKQKDQVLTRIFNNLDQAKVWIKLLKSNHFENQIVAQ